MPELSKFVRRRLATAAGDAGEHPDADLLTAFSENALLPEERIRILAHLTACGTCCEVLAVRAGTKSPVPSPVPVVRWPGLRFPLLRWCAVAALVLVVLGAVLRYRAKTGGSSSGTQSVREVQAEPAPTPVLTAAIAEGRQAGSGAGSRGVSSQATEPSNARQYSSAVRHQPGTVRPGTAAVQTAPPQAPVLSMPPASGASASLQTVPRRTDFTAPAKADLLGQVTDASGAMIANARVTLRDLRTSAERTATTDSGGRYFISPLPEGRYSLQVEKPGFQKYQVAEFSLSHSNRSVRNATLTVGRSAETVEVQGQAGQVGAQTASVGALAAPRKMENLALDKLSFTDLLSMPPGTPVPPAWRVTQTGKLTRIVAGSPAQVEVVEVAPQQFFHAVNAFAGEVWAGSKSGGLYHSSDNGRTWTAVSFPASAAIVEIKFDSRSEGRVTTADGQVYVTHDGGLTWIQQQ